MSVRRLFSILLVACFFPSTSTPFLRADGPLRAVEAGDWTDLFLRYDGWTGADGIFSANLDGTIIEGIELRPGQRTVFVFSDTIVGTVDTKTKKRLSAKMPNHSFALLSGNAPQPENIRFFYPGDDKTPKLPIRPREEDQWYWLSECFVLRENSGKNVGPAMYAFLLRMSKTGEGTFGFAHRGVDLLRCNIRDGEIDFASARVFEDNRDRPRIGICRDRNTDGPNVAFGIGVLENLESARAPNPDGYVYVYGHRDEKGKRELVAARFRPENVTKFETWEYYAGSEGKHLWSDTPLEAVGIAENISTEISVTPILSGPQKGKYALVYTPGTIGSKIALRLGTSPVGLFGAERIVYEETVSRELGQGVFAYNAKAHPVISRSGELLITYNVNSMDDSMRIFREAEIYRPRFVRIKLDEL